MQGAVYCVALDRDQPALHIRRQPGLHRRCETAEQRNAGRAVLREPAHQVVNLLGCVPHDPPRDRVAGIGMTHHQWCEGCIVGRSRFIHPRNGFERVVSEALHYVTRETGADGALVIGAQRHADRMQSEIGAAAFIGDRETIAADPDLASINNGKTDAARSDDDNAAVARAVVDSVEAGVIPKDKADDLCIMVGVFIHWDASDDTKIYDYNYQATKESIQRALAGKPTVSEVIAGSKTSKHPFSPK